MSNMNQAFNLCILPHNQGNVMTGRFILVISISYQYIMGGSWFYPDNTLRKYMGLIH